MVADCQHRLNPYTEGDRRIGTHAKACKPRSAGGSCEMSCRCWCHGITKHMNGDVRADSEREAER